MVANINARIPDTSIGLGMTNTLADSVAGFEASRALLITDKGIVNAGLLRSLQASLDGARMAYGVYDGCLPEPTAAGIQAVIEIIRSEGCDLLIAVGGGSIMDTAKVASVFTYGDRQLADFLDAPRGTLVQGRVIPKVLIPTTAGTGSEWSRVAVIYDGERMGIPGSMEKYGADKVIIDPELTRNLPPKITAETGFDALTHAVEAFTCKNANVISDALAGSAIKLVGQNLNRAYTNGPADIESRYHMSLAACMAMNAAVTSGMGLAHVIGEYVQSKARVSHGASLSVILPAVMRFNLTADPGKFARIAALLGENVADGKDQQAGARSILAVNALIDKLKLPGTLGEVGIKEYDIEPMARHCYENNAMVMKMWTSRDLSQNDISQLLRSSL